LVLLSPQHLPRSPGERGVTSHTGKLGDVSAGSPGELEDSFRAFAWSGDAKKLSSNDSFWKSVAKYSKLGQNERFLLHWVGLGTL
jgi:hypothetical protein